MIDAILQPGTGAIAGEHHLPATPDTVLWGRLPCGADSPVLTIGDCQSVTIDTVSHEGILEDQGKDPGSSGRSSTSTATRSSR